MSESENQTVQEDEEVNVTYFRVILTDRSNFTVRVTRAVRDESGISIYDDTVDSQDDYITAAVPEHTAMAVINLRSMEEFNDSSDVDSISDNVQSNSNQEESIFGEDGDLAL